VDAQFSAQYTAALALVSGRPRLRHFEAAAIRGNSGVLELGDRFETRERQDGGAGLTPVEIAVRLRDGGERRVRIDVPSGSPANSLSPGELREKLEDNLSYSLRSPDAAERRRIATLLATVQDSADVAGLVEAL
jgi:2-methylcitrate dehydratase PrpD